MSATIRSSNISVTGNVVATGNVVSGIDGDKLITTENYFNSGPQQVSLNISSS